MMKKSQGALIRQLVRDHQPAERSDDKNPWLQLLKKEAASWVTDMTLPNRKMEAWRYTPVEFIDSTAFADVEEGPFEALALTDIEELLLPGSESTNRIVFVNGHYAPDLSSLKEQDGVELYTLAGKRKLPAELKRRIGQADLSDHFFFTLNNALISDGAVIHVSREAGRQRHRLELLHVTVGMPDPVIHNPRHLIVLENGAALQLVERYASLGKSSYFNNAVVDIHLSEDARLLHTRLQEESEHAQHLTHLNVNLEAASHYHQVSLALGGAWSRTEARILFSGEHAHAELDGLILAGSKQLNDVHLEVLHEVPNCTSREHFKGLLDGNGKIVFDGRILVGRDAQKTEAALNNENLMLSRSAEVDTKPQLEIFADDVKCSHGATVGELDKEMLFYLRSRGIPKKDAERMLCTAFADEVIAALTEPAIRDHVNKVVLRRLAGQGKTS